MSRIAQVPNEPWMATDWLQTSARPSQYSWPALERRSFLKGAWASLAAGSLSATGLAAVASAGEPAPEKPFRIDVHHPVSYTHLDVYKRQV